MGFCFQYADTTSNVGMVACESINYTFYSSFQYLYFSNSRVCTQKNGYLFIYIFINFWIFFTCIEYQEIYKSPVKIQLASLIPLTYLLQRINQVWESNNFNEVRNNETRVFPIISSLSLKHLVHQNNQHPRTLYNLNIFYY